MSSDASQWTVDELLARCISQPVDEAAWGEFVRRFHPTIRSSVMRTFHRMARGEMDRRPQFTDEHSEDLVQSVYAKLVEDDMRALRQFEGSHDDSIYQYLVMISVNVVRDLFRETKAQKRPKISYSLDQLLEDGEGSLLDEVISGLDGLPMSRSNSAFTAEEIEKALNKAVRDKNRDRDLLIFQLRFYQGMKLDEIARVLGPEITSAKIGAILNRIIKRLKSSLEKSRRR
ncbi:MAG TPA: sigma-70 family RNA polymerase sigma factor [Blastocatellia bacterium]